ncbi:hypothetical protein [Allorhodopirellula solitaria]|uniref:Uncharacterized protein n=1 Tax=Allorhodopirellula solitaria TaxID=2527987 RepID=A0A5C5YFX0_9BACT|nr:hypothetical protein [Allorhodopirellula solitaria]TWT73948.1 hypothetical protein CA85_08300 [Allorhodopirellula solitaria]
MFDPFPATIALAPLIVYLIALSAIRLSGSACVVSGASDLAAVLVAVSGLIVIGPMELFFPNATASLLGVWVWLPLLLLYFLFACLLVLNGRPRLVVYGRMVEEVYPALIRAAQTLDSGATENEEQLQVYLPSASAHLRIDLVRGNDCCSVMAFEPALPPDFWNAFAKQFREELRQTAPPYPRRGWAMLIVASMMAFLLIRYVAAQPAVLVEGFREWLIR